ncbi:orotidine 5-phosphate decarboxylase [Tateyamaria sp. SN6-1]|uniref:orotidine 5-phosphate decarboxylase n=1 Tax=Tateyamaria sp. SN6-1 TaxID=3092148 RepID=UPI0039F56305
MQTVPLQLSDVIYNAATQSFEARVTVHDPRGARSYACAIDAPITMEFPEAADGLAKQAMRRHTHGRADATHMPSATPTRRSGRNTSWRRLVLDRFGARPARAA